VWAVLSRREGWEGLPLYALGASSGAAMVLCLALRMPLAGIVPQIMSLPPHMLEAKPEDPSDVGGAHSSPNHRKSPLMHACQAPRSPCTGKRSASSPKKSWPCF
jgi:hypothetical protein